jgi:hypothetical protein
MQVLTFIFSSCKRAALQITEEALKLKLTKYINVWATVQAMELYLTPLRGGEANELAPQ